MVTRPLKIEKLFFGTWSLLLLVALYLPVVFLVIFGFNSGSFALRWEGFSLRWYASTLENPEMISALFNSLLVASISTVLAVTLGFFYALWSHRHSQTKLTGATDALMTLPLFMPEIVISIGLLVVVAQVLRPGAELFGLQLDSMNAVILGHTTLALGYAALVLRNRFRSYDLQQELAAIDLGATRKQVFFQVMVPQLMPGFAAASCLAFAVSLDDFYVSYFLSTGGSSLQTLPLFIWSLQGRRAMTPEINVVSSLLLCIAMFFFAAGLLLSRSEPQGKHPKRSDS
ncbi:MAG: ABC transporter permease [Betaproteobacteria bacterium]|nr:ABC transporter permease [Betaproteobacteria bacterium]